MTPYNPYFGSFLVTKDRLAALPYDASPLYIPRHIRRAHSDLGSSFYLENWPYVPPVLIEASPFTAHQVSQEHSLPNFSDLRRFMQPIAGEFDLVTMKGRMCKKWRGILNPGFSAAHLISLVPDIVIEVGVFCAILREKMEEKTTFQMKQPTDNLTMDIIGKLVLWVEFSRSGWQLLSKLQGHSLQLTDDKQSPCLCSPSTNTVVVFRH